MNRILTDNQFLPFLEKTVQNAGKSIDIATFKAELCDKPRGRFLERLFKLIMIKARQGVSVRLLLNWHDDRKSVARTNHKVMLALKTAGVDVRYLPRNRCCHAKLFLIDDVVCFLGSHNLSVRSCHSNFEVSVLLTETDSLSAVHSVFNQSFSDAQTW